MSQKLIRWLSAIFILALSILPGSGVHSDQVNSPTAGTTERVSVASDGTQGNDSSEFTSISGDGRFVAFDSLATNLVSGDTNNVEDIFVYDRQTGITERVSVASDGTEANDQSWYYPSISADGRFVAFFSYATNLVSGDTNNSSDIFVHDRQTGITERVSVASDGKQGNEGSEYVSVLVRIMLDSVFASEPVGVGHYSIKNDTLVVNTLCERSNPL